VPEQQDIASPIFENIGGIIQRLEIAVDAFPTVGKCRMLSAGCRRDVGALTTKSTDGEQRATKFTRTGPSEAFALCPSWWSSSSSARDVALPDHLAAWA